MDAKIVNENLFRNGYSQSFTLSNYKPVINNLEDRSFIMDKSGDTTLTKWSNNITIIDISATHEKM